MMKPTGIIRRIDDLGRVVIPRELRRTMFGADNGVGQPMELFYEDDGTVIFKPYTNTNVVVPKKDIERLIGYVNSLLDLIDIDVDDFDEEEYEDTIYIVQHGYDDFVKPIENILNETN